MRGRFCGGAGGAAVTPSRYARSARISTWSRSSALFPFGLGRRVCIGESFAWTEAVLALAALARDWAPTLVPGHPIVLRPAVTLRPMHGLRMVLHRR